MPTQLFANRSSYVKVKPPYNQTASNETENREKLMRHLHRGGRYSHLWTDTGNRSYWFRVNGCTMVKERTVPQSWRDRNVYFAVHPLTQIPPHNTSGNTDPSYISSQLPYIAAINTLFAEYDGKDYVWPWEYAHYLPENVGWMKPVERRTAVKKAKEQAFYRSPATFKNRVLQAINALYFAPSVILDSGGGYHCYWLLNEPVPVDEANRTELQSIQHSWVEMVNGDLAASDLRRVLRLPGSVNMKPGFGSTPPKVSFVKTEFELTYRFGELEEAVNDWLFANQPQAATLPTRRKAQNSNAPTGDDLRVTFNRSHSLVDLLVAHGYIVTYRSASGTRLARPGRDKPHSSVTVFPAKPNGTPEISVHFSSSDELHSEEYIDPESNKMRRHAHDAFAVFVKLEHNADWQAATAAIRGA